VISETFDAVDFDDWYPLAILPLQFGIGRDIHHDKVASANRSHDVDGRPAEVAARSGVDDDAISRHPATYG
jgi:hypothetical protein